MSYTVQSTPRFDKDYKKLDSYTQRFLAAWIRKYLEGCINPRYKGKALTADWKNHWRYRIGDYRLICLIKDNELIILTIAIGHRKDIYDK